MEGRNLIEIPICTGMLMELLLYTNLAQKSISYIYSKYGVRELLQLTIHV